MITVIHWLKSFSYSPLHLEWIPSLLPWYLSIFIIWPWNIRFFSLVCSHGGGKKKKNIVYVPVRRKDSKQKVKHQWLYGSKYYEEKLDREGIYGKVDVINKDATFEQDLKGVREWVTWTYEIKVAGRSIANIKTLSGPMTEVVSFISCFLGVGSIIILQCCVAAAAAESL